MAEISSIAIPQDSLLARFGGPDDYRDCFTRDVPGEVSLPEYIERFYCSMAFRPEAIILSLIGSSAMTKDARQLARGETERFGVWQVVERRDDQILLHSKGTGTASWFAIERLEQGTRLYFGSWVGNIEQTGWRVMLGAHIWYSRFLLGGV